MTEPFPVGQQAGEPSTAPGYCPGPLPRVRRQGMGRRGQAVGDWLTERIAGWVCPCRQYLMDRVDDELPAASGS